MVNLTDFHQNLTLFYTEVKIMAKKKKTKKKTTKKKTAKKKSTKKTAKNQPKEVLVVASKVKAYVKSKGMMTSSDAIEALSEEVYKTLDAAIERTEANRRSTVKPQDL